MKSMTDALGNKIEVVKNDYMTLQPSELKDANGVTSKVVFDALRNLLQQPDKNVKQIGFVAEKTSCS